MSCVGEKARFIASNIRTTGFGRCRRSTRMLIFDGVTHYRPSSVTTSAHWEKRVCGRWQCSWMKPSRCNHRVVTDSRGVIVSIEGEHNHELPSTSGDSSSSESGCGTLEPFPESRKRQSVAQEHEDGTASVSAKVASLDLSDSLVEAAAFFDHVLAGAGDGQAEADYVGELLDLTSGSGLDAYVPGGGPFDEDLPLQQEPGSLESGAQPFGSVADDEMFQVVRGFPAGYTITYDRLGKGGFGKVQLAQMEVAMKIQKVHENGLFVAWKYDQCKAEIALHRQLNHPHIVRFFDAYFSETELKFYISLEKMEGDLTKLLEYNIGFITEEHAAVVIRGIMRALAFMHGQGLVHRDVKGLNVLLGRYCTAKLADLGMVIKDGGMGIASWGGSVSHWSPEMALLYCNNTGLWAEPLADPHGAATDCWSLGITITEIMLGKVLNDNVDSAELAMRIWCTDYAGTVLSALPQGDHCANLRKLTSACLLVDAYERSSMEQLLFEFPFLDAPGDDVLREPIARMMQGIAAAKNQ